MQLLINILIFCLPVLLIALSFATIYQTTKFFHIAHAAIITLGAYFTFLFSVQLHVSLFFAALISIICAICISILIELLIYKPLRKKQISSWKVLIASLGLYVILQNLISLIWGNETQSVRTWQVKVGHEFFGAYISDAQIIIIVVSIILFTATIFFLKYTSLGKQIRAVSSNPELSNIFGISSNWIILWSFVIGSALAAIAGILIVVDTYDSHNGFSCFSLCCCSNDYWWSR